MIGAVRGRPALLLCAMLAAAALACGSPDVSCPNDYPKSCPSPAPTFAGQAHAVFQARCQACHEVGGLNKPLTTWAQINADLADVVVRVKGCNMPPLTAPAPTSDERATLLAWFRCGALDN
jgi:uncharacterized membrane protein